MNPFGLKRKETETPSHKERASLDEAAVSPEIEACWKQEALERGAAFDGGQMAERDATDLVREAYRI